MVRPSSEAPVRSPITVRGTLPAEFSANYKAATEPSRSVSPASPGFTVFNSSSVFLEGRGALIGHCCHCRISPQNKANAPSSRSGIFGIFRSLGVAFQRHILIGSLG